MEGISEGRTFQKVKLSAAKAQDQEHVCLSEEQQGGQRGWRRPRGSSGWVGQEEPSRALEALQRIPAYVLLKWELLRILNRGVGCSIVSEGHSDWDVGKPGRRLDLNLDMKPDLTQYRKIHPDLH